MVIKIRRGDVEGEVVYIALGIDEDGYKEVLGFWIIGAEGKARKSGRKSFMSLKGEGLRNPFSSLGMGLKVSLRQ